MTDDLTQPQESDSDLVKRLRQEIKNRDTAIAETSETAAEATKRAAFLEAGLSPSEGPAALLFKSYDGDVTPEAVKAAAEEYGIGTQPAAPPSTEEKLTEAQREAQAARQAEEAAHQAMDSAAGGDAPDSSPPDITAAGRQAYAETLARTGDNDEAMAKQFEGMMGAAIQSQKQGAR